MKRIIASKLFIVRSIVVLLSATMLFACQNDIKTVFALAGDDSIPASTTKDMEYIRSDSGKMIAKLTSPLMHKHDGEGSYVIFPEGLKIEFYDKYQKLKSTLTAEYGIKYEKRKLLIVKKNVIVINLAEQKQLNTEELTWDERLKKIYSEVNVKLTTPDEVSYGTGMESDEKFSRYEIFNSKGEHEIEEKIDK
ncbi:MAG: LPS export ABC transporter periplasmic protein LptC [Bacteroidetes bacterium]|nr:LPS export ABC transporter periplasmic protein LptC [Bacteroidota bacterium]